MNSWPTRWASLIDAKAAWALECGGGTGRIAVELARVGGAELDVAVVTPPVTLASGEDAVACPDVWFTGGRPAEVDVHAASTTSTSSALPVATRRVTR
jgi:hypothetical protein